MAYPADYKYTKEHEWLKVEGNTGTIGITDHAQESLGDIVFVELPKVGSEITAGKTFGTVESVKAVSDLFAPVSGTVTAVNEALNTSPEQVNKDAHGAWMVKVTLKDPERGEPVCCRSAITRSSSPKRAGTEVRFAYIRRVTQVSRSWNETRSSTRTTVLARDDNLVSVT